MHKTYFSKTGLLKHLKIIHKKYNEPEFYQCANCEKKFKTELYLNNHMKFIHDTAVNLSCKCKICEKPFKSKRHLQSHNSRMHTIRSAEDEKRYQCSTCKNKFKNSDILNKHIEAVHEDKKWRCDICYKPFSRKSHLELHVKRIHEKIKDYKCDSCEKSYASNHELNKHIKTLHLQLEMPKYQKCELCNKTMQESTLKKHVKQFHGTKKILFSCDICQKGFINLGKINLHMKKMHSSNETPYECDTCQKKFKDKKNMKIHKIIHLPREDPERNQRKNFKFEVCNKAYDSKESLEIYSKDVHSNAKSYECKICNTFFNFQTNLTRHIKRFHNYL